MFLNTFFCYIIYQEWDDESLFSYLFGFFLDFAGLIGALYISGLITPLDKISHKEAIKKAVYASLIIILIVRICGIVIVSPLLLSIISILAFGYAINHFYGEEWVVIFAMALLLSFIFMLVTTSIAAVLIGRTY